jgi:hypothetical protein
VPEVVVVPVIKSIAPELADVVFAVKKSRSVVPVPPVIDVIPVRAKLPVVLFSATEVVPMNTAELPRTVLVRVPVTFAPGTLVSDAPEPLNVVPVTVPGKDVFPEASSSVAVLTSVVKTPVYCLTWIGSVPSSAVAISAKPVFVAVPPTRILNWSLSAMFPRTSSAELVPATVATTVVGIA